MNSFQSDSERLSPRWHSILNKSTLALSGIGLLADVLGIGKLAYDIVIVGNLADIGFKLVVLVIVFLFGIGLGIVAIKGFGNMSVLLLGRFFAWVYIAIACLSYLGVIFALRQQTYDVNTYVAFILVMLAQLLAVKAIHLVLRDSIDIQQYSIPVLAVCLVHAVLILYTYVYSGVTVSLYLAGDLLFFTGMTLIGSAMLGDIAFRTMLERL